VVVDAAVGGKRNSEEDVEMDVVVVVVGDEAGGEEMDTVVPVEGDVIKIPDLPLGSR
jgi:hypothetical protein